MINCLSAGCIPDRENLIHLEIEKLLKDSSKKKAPEIKILLLGSAESGKSTIFKQLRNYYKQSFTPEEENFFFHLIAENYLDMIKRLIVICVDKQISLDFDIPKEHFEALERRASMETRKGSFLKSKLNAQVLSSERQEPLTDGPSENIDTNAAESNNNSAFSVPQEATSKFTSTDSTECPHNSTDSNKRPSVDILKTDLSPVPPFKKPSLSQADPRAFSAPTPKLPAYLHPTFFPLPQGSFSLLHLPYRRYSRSAYLPILSHFYHRNTDALHSALAFSSEYLLPDSTAYFLPKVETLFKEYYTPSFDDILHARSATTGIEDIRICEPNFPLDLRVIDVGGQRGERKKWMDSMLADVSALIYVASLSEFDQKDPEDTSLWRMQSSLDLYRRITSSHFDDKPVILFLNKKDLFAEKMEAKRSRMEKDAPREDYLDILLKKNKEQAKEAQEERPAEPRKHSKVGKVIKGFLREKRGSQTSPAPDKTDGESDGGGNRENLKRVMEAYNRNYGGKSYVTHHVMQATDTNCFVKVWGVVKSLVFESNLKMSGLLLE